MTDPLADGWWRVHFRKNQILVHGKAELDRICARKVPKVILVEPAKIHECSICGKTEAWTETWSWFGSYFDLDDEKPVLKFCSAPCQAKGPKERKPKGPTRKTKRFSGHRPRDDWKTHDYGAVIDAKRAADPRRFPMPEHPKIPDLKKGEGQCRWCGGRITGKYAHQRTFHRASKGERDCRGEWASHTDLSYQRSLLEERDGPDCQLCPAGFGNWVDGGEMPIWMSSWSREDRITPPGNHIVWSQVLEVDHVVELWEVADLPDDERRPFFGPENLWLLCKQHHRLKTAKAAADRAAARSSAAP